MRQAGQRVDRATLYRLERYRRLLLQMRETIVNRYAPYVAGEVTAAVPAQIPPAIVL